MKKKYGYHSKTVTCVFVTFCLISQLMGLFLFLMVFIMFVFLYVSLFRETTEDADSQGDASSQPDTISIASRTSQNTVDSDKVGQQLSSMWDILSDCFRELSDLKKSLSRNKFFTSRWKKELFYIYRLNWVGDQKIQHLWFMWAMLM